MLLRLSHTGMQLAMSFIGGVMLGVGILHLLPHAFFELQDIYHCVWWLLGGFLTMFFIERVFHFHHHDVPPDDSADDHGHDHDPSHGHAHGHAHSVERPRGLAEPHLSVWRCTARPTAWPWLLASPPRRTSKGAIVSCRTGRLSGHLAAHPV